MKALALCLLILTAGCASSPDVVLVGNGRYVVSGRASGPLNAGQDTLQAANAAKAYCAKQSKQMVIQNIEDVSVTFSCETKQRDL
jgi:putative hemolysin